MLAHIEGRFAEARRHYGAAAEQMRRNRSLHTEPFYRLALLTVAISESDLAAAEPLARQVHELLGPLAADVGLPPWPPATGRRRPEQHSPDGSKSAATSSTRSWQPARTGRHPPRRARGGQGAHHGAGRGCGNTLQVQRRARRALTPWREHYNNRPRHSALGGRAPISRLSPT